MVAIADKGFNTMKQGSAVVVVYGALSLDVSFHECVHSILRFSGLRLPLSRMD